MAQVATLKKSDGTTLSTTLNPITLQSIHHAGLGVSSDGTHTLNSLKNATIDALFAAATALNPISLGLDLLRQVPSFYPERL